MLTAFEGSRLSRYAAERIAFIYKNAASCLFPDFIFILLALSKVVELPIPRYDFLLIGCLAMQLLMVWWRLETLDETQSDLSVSLAKLDDGTF